MESFVIEQKVLFRVDFLSVTWNHRIQCPRVGLGVKIKDILDFLSSCMESFNLNNKYHLEYFCL